MSRSDWLQFFKAVGLIVTAGAAGFTVILLSTPQPNTTNNAKQAQTQKPKTARNQSAPRSVETIEVVDPEEEKRPCKPGEDNRKSDLCAQWKAADAARDAAFWSMFSVALAGFGTVGLFWTLHYTRRAVVIASNAAKDQDKALEIAERNAKSAEMSAKAAQRSVDYSLDIGRKQVRAYLIMDTNKIAFGFVKGSRNRLYIRVPMKNYGRSPARDVNVNCNLIRYHQGRMERSEDWQSPLVRSEIDIKTYIAPGEERSDVWLLTCPGIQGWGNGPERWSRELRPEDFPIHLAADVVFSYIDIFDDVTTQYFRADCRLENMDDSVRAKILLLTGDPQGAGDIYPMS